MRVRRKCEPLAKVNDVTRRRPLARAPTYCGNSVYLPISISGQALAVCGIALHPSSVVGLLIGTSIRQMKLILHDQLHRRLLDPLLWGRIRGNRHASPSRTNMNLSGWEPAASRQLGWLTWLAHLLTTGLLGRSGRLQFRTSRLDPIWDDPMH